MSDILQVITYNESPAFMWKFIFKNNTFRYVLIQKALFLLVLPGLKLDSRRTSQKQVDQIIRYMKKHPYDYELLRLNYDIPCLLKDLGAPTTFIKELGFKK